MAKPVDNGRQWTPFCHSSTQTQTKTTLPVSDLLPFDIDLPLIYKPSPSNPRPPTLSQQQATIICNRRGFVVTKRKLPLDQLLALKFYHPLPCSHCSLIEKWVAASFLACSGFHRDKRRRVGSPLGLLCVSQVFFLIFSFVFVPY